LTSLFNVHQDSFGIVVTLVVLATLFSLSSQDEEEEVARDLLPPPISDTSVSLSVKQFGTKIIYSTFDQLKLYCT